MLYRKHAVFICTAILTGRTATQNNHERATKFFCVSTFTGRGTRPTLSSNVIVTEFRNLSVATGCVSKTKSAISENDSISCCYISNTVRKNCLHYLYRFYVTKFRYYTGWTKNGPFYEVATSVYIR